jgi:hypothetical protein
MRPKNVVNVCFKCFRCFRGMLQEFYIDVAKVYQDVAYIASVSEILPPFQIISRFYFFYIYFAMYLNIIICLNT